MGQPGQLGAQFGGDDWIVRKLQDLERAMRELAAADLLATAGIGVIPDGVIVNGQMQFKRTDGTLGVSVDPTTGTFVAYNATGTTAVARFGSLIETSPGNYGVEVKVGSTWVQVGAQTTTWSTISGKPGDVGGATIPGTFITGTVPDATTATTAAQADGTTTTAFNRDIAGIPGTYKAMWMHSTNVIGYNTSDEKYKRNIRKFDLTDEQMLAFRAVIYDRKATGADEYTPAVRGDELGLIAREVEAVSPELALKFDGEIDSVFYERLPVALLPVIQRQHRRILKQADQIAALTQAVRELGGNI